MHNTPWQSRNRQFSIFGSMQGKNDSNIYVRFLFYSVKWLKPNPWFQFLSWTSNRILKMFVKTVSNVIFLQLGLVYLSLVAMDIQFRKLLLKLSQTPNEFHSRLQICSFIVMNRDYNITAVKMSALFGSERIVLILFAVINGRHNLNLRWHYINAHAGGKRIFLVPLSRQSDAIFFHGDSNQILSERQTMPRRTKNVNREREASNWARSLLENN